MLAPLAFGHVLCREAILLAVLLGAGLGIVPAPVQAQETEEAVALQYPGPFETTRQLRALTDAAVSAEEQIATVGQTIDLETELEDIQERLLEVRTLLASVAEAEYVRPERLLRVRDQAVQVEQDFESVRQQAMERLETLDGLRVTWIDHREYWQGWEDALRQREQLQPVQTEFRVAQEEIEDVLRRIEDVVPDLLEVQQEAATMRSDAAAIAEQVVAIRIGRREALLQRAQPVLFSPAYFEALFDELRVWRPIDAPRARAYLSFFRESAPLILLHLALIIGLALLARRLRSLSIPEGAWSGLLLRPRALAVFAVTAALAGRYPLGPPLWDVLIWLLLASSGAVLATRLVRAQPLRVMVYFFAGLYPIFLFMEALVTPPSIFRPLLALAALMGLAVFGFNLRRAMRDQPASPWITWSLGLGCAVWFFVLVAEILGFYLLARWILHATVTTAYVVFLVAFMVVLARGATRTLVRLEEGRLSFFRSIGFPLMERLLKLFQLVLVVAAFLYILDIWEVALSPAETWSRIAALGVTFAGVEITLGRVLLAGFLVYLAVLLSWVIRALTRTEVYPRWELERGVADSINALVHYFLITLGVIIGLGALGVELQNFAIVAGALGVGIGFGLQNIVNNFVSGLILLFERPVRAGDTIVIENELGTIHKIGLRSTTVVTFDKAEVIVPNGDLVSEKVTNWTLTDSVARLILPVGVAYGTNVARVLDLLGQAAENHPEVLPDPPPMPLFIGFGDSALEFELRVWVADLRRRLIVRSDILADIDRLFRDDGIEIPFPQRDLHLRSVDPTLLAAARPDRDAGPGASGASGREPRPDTDRQTGPAPLSQPEHDPGSETPT
jgi:potassium-dependent mechanosensitive channel